MTFSVVVVGVNKGESLRDTVRDDRGDGRRRDRRAPRSAGAPWQRIAQWIDASVVNAGDGWHEHPTQALLDCYTIRTELGRRDGSTACTSRSSATSSTAAWPAATCWPSPRSAPTSRSSRRRRCCRRRSTAGRSTSATTSTTCCPTLDVALPAAHAARAAGRGAAARRCASTRRATASRASGPPGCRTHTLVMHPGPMNRGVEIAAEVAELPGSVITEQVDQRRRRAHGRAVPAARLGRRSRTVRLMSDAGDPRRRRARRQPGERRADVLVDDGQVVDGRCVDLAGDVEVLDAGGCIVAPGPRRPPRPPARARPRGGRDDRDRSPGRRARRVHRGRRHAQHRAGPSTRRPSSSSFDAAGELGAALCATCCPAGCITDRPRRQAHSRRSASWPRSACASSPTTATACRTPRLMRRALEYAGGARRHAGAALRGRGSRRRRPACTRARGRAGSASPVGRPRPRS